MIGNHESTDGDHYNRYLNQTWGEAYGEGGVNSSNSSTRSGGGGPFLTGVTSTADTALGHLLSKGAK